MSEPNLPSPAWGPVNVAGPFTSLVGPVFQTFDNLPPDEPTRLGFRVEKRHANVRDSCHGGMVASFADIAMARGIAAKFRTTLGAPTLNLTIDFIAPAYVGDWVESRISMVERTNRTVFISCLLVTAAGPVARASGIFRLILPES